VKPLSVPAATRGRGYHPPRFSRTARLMMRLAAPFYLRAGERLNGVTLINPDSFCRPLREHQEGKYRLIILFRHSDKADAPALLQAVTNLSVREGRRLGIRYKTRPHAFFLYGKDVLNWAGAPARWFFPRLGHIPVTNRGYNRRSVEDIRKTLEESRHPLALAPEGQVTYHSHRCFPLESGISYISGWAGQHGPVRILPVSLVYDYGKKKDRMFSRALRRWMNETGLSLETGGSPYSILMEMTDKTVLLLEKSFPPESAGDDLDERIQALNHAILNAGENAAGISPFGTFLDRIFRLRYRGVDTRYPENRDPARFTPWEKSASGYDCLSAAWYIRCSQIADVLEYIHTGYIEDTELNNRHCEYVLNLLDLVNRFRGGDISSRYVPGLRKARLLSGSLIDPSVFHLEKPVREASSLYREKLQEELQRLSSEIEKYLS